MAEFLDLPQDVLHLIAHNFLNCQDIHLLSKVCKPLNRSFSDDFWRKFVAKYTHISNHSKEPYMPWKEFAYQYRPFPILPKYQDTDIAISIFDIGGSTAKVGFAGEETPRSIFPTIFAHSPTNLQKYIGHQAGQHFDENLEFDYLPGNAYRLNVESFQVLWNFAFFHELRTKPEESPIMWPFPTFAARYFREKMTEMVFEVFESPAFYLKSTAVLELFSTGRTTGLVMDSGETTLVIPIYEGYELPHAFKRLDLGGHHITSFLHRLLKDRGVDLDFNRHFNFLEKMKKETSRVALDFDQQIQKSSSFQPEANFTLPDKQVVNLGVDSYKCGEVLFQPWQIIQSNESSLPQACFQSIGKCDYEIRSELSQNITVFGGATYLPGFVQRLQQEIANLYFQKNKKSQAATNNVVKISAPRARHYAAWTACSILGELSTFENMWISKEEYEESGPSICYPRRW